MNLLFFQNQFLLSSIHLIIHSSYWKGTNTNDEGLMINQPMMIETIDEQEKIEPLLLPLKQMIGDNGFITIHKVEVV